MLEEGIEGKVYKIWVKLFRRIAYQFSFAPGRREQRSLYSAGAKGCFYRPAIAKKVKYK